MKEIKETFLNFITGTKTILLSGYAKVVSVYMDRFAGVVLVYEDKVGEQILPLSEFTFHLIAPFDFVPINSTYLGTISKGDSTLHVYQDM